MTEENKKPEGITTHAVAARPVRPPTELEVFKSELNRDYSKQVANYFMGDKEKAMKFMSAAVYSVQKTPKLLECDKQSLMTSLMTCAEYGLYPSNASGEAFILPYAGKAQFQLGYQGVITLLYRAGVQSIQTNIVYEKDDFDYEEGLEPRLVHKPNLKEDRGEPMAVYAIAVVNGQKLFKVMSESDVMKFKEFSKSKASDFSPWNAKQDPELHMWRKTAIKQLSKVLPKNDQFSKAVEEDNEDSIIADRAKLDAGGPAVAKAFHEPTNEQ